MADRVEPGADGFRLLVPRYDNARAACSQADALLLVQWEELLVPCCAAPGQHKFLLFILLSGASLDFLYMMSKHEHIQEQLAPMVAPHTLRVINLDAEPLGAIFFAVNAAALGRLGAQTLFVHDWSAPYFGWIRANYASLINFAESRIAQSKILNDAAALSAFVLSLVNEDSPPARVVPATSSSGVVVVADTSASVSLLSLPDDLILHVLRFLSVSTVVRSRLVCRRLNELARDPSLFRYIFAGCEFNDEPIHALLAMTNDVLSDENDAAVREESVIALLRAVGTHVRKLDLRNTQTSYGLFMFLPQLCPSLEHLVAISHPLPYARNMSFTYQCFVHVVRHMPSLKTCATIGASPLFFNSAALPWSDGECPVVTRTSLVSMADVRIGMVLCEREHFLMQVDSIEKPDDATWFLHGSSVWADDARRRRCSTHHALIDVVVYELEAVDLIVLGFASPHYPFLLDPRTNRTRADIAIGSRMRFRVHNQLNKGVRPSVRAYGYFDVWFINCMTEDLPPQQS